MRVLQQPAYVLHLRPWRETSLLLECLSRDHGRLGLIARGVRRDRSRLSRAQLEPLQRLRIDYGGRGELATLYAAENEGARTRLRGDGLIAGLYINELVMRLVARQDPHPQLFDAYARTLQRLTSDEPIAWVLRRFERDLLATLGYALELEREAEAGQPVMPDGEYSYVPGHGPVASRDGRGIRVRGEDLLALAGERTPSPRGLSVLRRLMRAVIVFHLDGGELKAWRVLSPRRRQRDTAMPE